MEDNDKERLEQLQTKIEELTLQLEEAKQVVRNYSQVLAELSQNAAEERAKNQGAGRGLDGMIFGQKYRASQRRAAAASNARISKDLAKKRGVILEKKTAAQATIQNLQTELKVAKEEYNTLKASIKSENASKNRESKKVIDSVTLLKKLKEAHDLGLLTDEEFEEKRKKLVSEI
jgi:cell division septum initiation protein DivIVA